MSEMNKGHICTECQRWRDIAKEMASYLKRISVLRDTNEVRALSWEGLKNYEYEANLGNYTTDLVDMETMKAYREALIGISIGLERPNPKDGWSVFNWAKQLACKALDGK